MSQEQEQQSQPNTHIHTPPTPFSPSSLHLLTQGAEALVYQTTFLTPTTPCLLKYRPPKPWRHSILDKRLTRSRILAESRILSRCLRDGVSVPAILGLGLEEGWVAMEWVDGSMVRIVIKAWEDEQKKQREEKEEEGIQNLMAKIGMAVGKLHQVGVVHGDLTTSNLMLRPTREMQILQNQRDVQDQGEKDVLRLLNGEIVLIDFGLAQTSTQEEDRAVDLYVLERAFASTHPLAEKAFDHVLVAYGQSYKGSKAVLKRLDEVRMRGRKKSMLG